MVAALSTTRATLVEQAEKLCRERDASLLFLTLFGATLYGTETPDKSDLDVRGVFLPSLESLVLGQAPHSLHLSTADAKGRNAAHDVDLGLWSIQHWLLKLLPAGDMAGLDLLFAPSHTACTLYRNPRLDKVFAAPLRFLDLTGRGYAAYVFKQTKKYGVKGSRAGALKAVRAWLAAHYPKPAPNERLGDCLDALPAACVNDRHCFLTEINGEKALQLGGKLHAASTRLAEFARRVEAELQPLAARLAAAERNENLDFKAFSHALRALAEMSELLQTGRIIFPLQNREELLAVKNGRHTWAELEPLILKRLAAVDALRASARPTTAYDPAFAQSCVQSCYAPTCAGPS